MYFFPCLIFQTTKRKLNLLNQRERERERERKREKERERERKRERERASYYTLLADLERKFGSLK